MDFWDVGEWGMILNVAMHCGGGDVRVIIVVVAVMVVVAVIWLILFKIIYER